MHIQNSLNRMIVFIIHDLDVALGEAGFADALARLDASERSTVYVCDGAGRPVGAITAEMARNGQDLTGPIDGDAKLAPVQTVSAAAVIEDMLPLAMKSEVPVAVLDGQGALIGGVPRRTVLAALVRRTE